ncbi:MAG: sigma-70 family RNA polymerase sigma factor [Acidimicrobiia bacterium]
MKGSPSSAGAEALAIRLHTDHADALFTWALGRTPDRRDAEELVAEAIVKAWKRYDQFDAERGSERAWIFGIARNALIDMHRSSQRRLRLVTDKASAESSVDDGTDAFAESSLVREAMASLTEEHRAVVVAAYFKGLNTKEISERHGVPPGTVRSRMYYAMRSLRASLEEKGVLL